MPDMVPAIALIAVFLLVVLVLRHMNGHHARNPSTADPDRPFRAED